MPLSNVVKRNSCGMCEHWERNTPPPQPNNCLIDLFFSSIAAVRIRGSTCSSASRDTSGVWSGAWTGSKRRSKNGCEPWPKPSVCRSLGPRAPRAAGTFTIRPSRGARTQPTTESSPAYPWPPRSPRTATAATCVSSYRGPARHTICDRKPKEQVTQKRWKRWNKNRNLFLFLFSQLLCTDVSIFFVFFFLIFFF